MQPVSTFTLGVPWGAIMLWWVLFIGTIVGGGKRKRRNGHRRAPRGERCGEPRRAKAVTIHCIGHGDALQFEVGGAQAE